MSCFAKFRVFKSVQFFYTPCISTHSDFDFIAENLRIDFKTWLLKYILWSLKNSSSILTEINNTITIRKFEKVWERY